MVSLDSRDRRNLEIASAGEAAWRLALKPIMTRMHSVLFPLHSAWGIFDARLVMVMEGYIKPPTKYLFVMATDLDHARVKTIETEIICHF